MMKRYIILVAALSVLAACSDGKQAEPKPEPSVTVIATLT